MKPTTERMSTWDRLLEAAARLFWSNGYASTTTREIAESLGVRKASLYHHISSKEDLLFEISVNSLQHMIDRTRTALDGVTDPLERVRVLVHAHVTSMIVDQNKHSVMLTELRALSPKRRAAVVELRDDYERLIASVLEPALEAGALRRDIPVKYLRLSLLNLLNWSIFWFRSDGELSPDRLAEYFTDLYVEGARSGSTGGLPVTPPDPPREASP